MEIAADQSILSPMIDLIGVPFDLCGRRQGSRLGPSAIRMEGIQAMLEGLGNEVTDTGDIPIPLPATTFEPGLAHFSQAVDVLRSLRYRVIESINLGSIPIVLGGDHSISIGSIGGALEAYRSDLAVLWIDAHADINRPDTSPSGNLHGMSLAALQGIPSSENPVSASQWDRLVSTMVPTSKLSGDFTAWFGLRDVDEGESEAMMGQPKSFICTMNDVDRHGVQQPLAAFLNWLRLREVGHLWISFDVDVLDPILAPGTGTAVRGGLSYREAHLLAELLHEGLANRDCRCKLVGIDIVETNPIEDLQNQTAKMAVEWVSSLFGKSILGSNAVSTVSRYM